MTTIENNTRRRIPWLAILIIICWLFLAAGLIHTRYSFTVRMNAVQADMDRMDQQADAILAELEAMR